MIVGRAIDDMRRRSRASPRNWVTPRTIGKPARRSWRVQLKTFQEILSRHVMHEPYAATRATSRRWERCQPTGDTPTGAEQLHHVKQNKRPVTRYPHRRLPGFRAQSSRGFVLLRRSARRQCPSRGNGAETSCAPVASSTLAACTHSACRSRLIKTFQPGSICQTCATKWSQGAARTGRLG